MTDRPALAVDTPSGNDPVSPPSTDGPGTGEATDDAPPAGTPADSGTAHTDGGAHVGPTDPHPAGEALVDASAAVLDVDASPRPQRTGGPDSAVPPSVVDTAPAEDPSAPDDHDDPDHHDGPHHDGPEIRNGQNGQNDEDDEDEVEDEDEGLGAEKAEVAPERDAPEPPGPVLQPRLRLEWPGPLVPTLVAAVGSEPGGLDPRRLVEETRSLWDVLASAVHTAGPGCVRPESLRWARRTGWQLALAPGYDLSGTPLDRGTDGFDAAAPVAGWRRDQQALVGALVHAAAGRRPRDAADARRLVDLGAGRLAPGLDALVDALLAGTGRPGDVSHLHRVQRVLSRRASGRLTGRCFVESVVGSRKARGRGFRDNEDAAAAQRTASGAVCLAVFDGTTDDGSGSGFTAARAAREGVRAAWHDGVDDPVEVLTAAEAAVLGTDSPGASTAVIVRVEPDGTGRLAAVGDSAAWLVRPLTPGGGEFLAWRLTPTHTVFADQQRTNTSVAWGHSDITHYLGGAADQPFVTELAVAEGDLLVALTDGALTVGRDEWFGTVLRRLAADRVATGRPLAAGLAVDLVLRAESHGGWDNATALVAEFTAS